MSLRRYDDVRPHERQREYIATQIVAEYLKSFFGCDAIIYRSAMQRDEEQDVRNIVILNRDGFVGEADPYVLSYSGWSMEDVRSAVHDGGRHGVLEAQRLTMAGVSRSGRVGIRAPSAFIPRVFAVVLPAAGRLDRRKRADSAARLGSEVMISTRPLIISISTPNAIGARAWHMHEVAGYRRPRKNTESGESGRWARKRVIRPPAAGRTDPLGR